MSEESDVDCENIINKVAKAYCDNLISSVSREMMYLSHGVMKKNETDN